MPRKFLKRHLPDLHALRQRRGMGLLAPLLDAPDLLQLSRRSVATAAAVGMLVAFMPVPGQMLIAAGAAIVVRCNLPLAVAMVWVTNPVTTPPIVYFCYRVGAWLLGRSAPGWDFQPSLDWFQAQLDLIWQPLLLGSLVCGLVAAAMAYLIVNLAWRLAVGRALKRRRERRRWPRD